MLQWIKRLLTYLLTYCIR